MVNQLTSADLGRAPTEAELQWAADHEACSRAQEEIAREHMSIEMAIDTWPSWFLQYASDCLDDTLFDRCVRIVPWVALQRCSSRLTDEQFAWCMEVAPWDAIRWCSGRMTVAQRTACLQACGDDTEEEE